MAETKSDSPFGGFFIGVGAVGGALLGLSAAAEQGENGCAGILAGLLIGALIGGVVEHVLGFLWKLLLVALTILLMILRIQACSAIRQEMSRASEDRRNSVPIEAPIESSDETPLEFPMENHPITNTDLSDFAPPVSPTKNSLRACNLTSNLVRVAVGYQDNKIWRAKGWYKIEPNECSQIISGFPPHIYAYATTDTWGNSGTHWISEAGQVKFCVDSRDAFELSNEPCKQNSHPDYRFQLFGAVILKDTDTFTWNLTPHPNSRQSEPTPREELPQRRDWFKVLIKNNCAKTINLRFIYERADGSLARSGGIWSLPPHEQTYLLDANNQHIIAFGDAAYYQGYVDNGSTRFDGWNFYNYDGETFGFRKIDLFQRSDYKNLLSYQLSCLGPDM